MGLAEQLLAGADLSRNRTTFFTDPIGSGSASFGASYALLGITPSSPCRIRFYGDESSLNNSHEVSRAFGDTNISSSVALIADISMSVADEYTLDPVRYAIPRDSEYTYYRIEPATSQSVLLRYYQLEDANIPVDTGSFYATSNRRTITGIQHELASSELASGSLTGPDISKTFLLVSASVGGTGTVARLRLYGREDVFTDVDEVNRNFSTEPENSTALIVDTFISGSDPIQFVPIIAGANINTLGSSLTPLVGNRTLIDGEDELYYILENTGGATGNFTASVHIFSLEE